MNQTKTRYILIVILIIFIVGLTAYFSTKSNDNHLAVNSKNLQDVENWYLLEMPNLNFQTKNQLKILDLEFIRGSNLYASLPFYISTKF